MNSLHAAIHPIALFDTQKNTNGLFAVNGLKKPLYYLYSFLSNLYPQIIEVTAFYLITRKDSSLQILFFNESTEKSVDYEFNFFNLQRDYKLAEKRLEGSNSCMAYWSQLDYQHPLSDADFSSIEAMSAPKTAFRLIPQGKIYTYPCTLAPQDIVLLKIT